MAKPVGALAYTQMLNDKGGIECDLTAARVAEDEYYIVTGTGFATHDFDWIARNIPTGMNAQLFDVTSGYAVLSLYGTAVTRHPRSVTRADLSNAASRSARRRSSASPDARFAPCVLPMSASWGGNCTCLLNTRPPFTGR